MARTSILFTPSVAIGQQSGIDVVVLRMRADELDVGTLHSVGEGDDQPVVVALDVEDHPVVTDYARVPVLFLDISG
jgi:hypothetical protein